MNTTDPKKINATSAWCRWRRAWTVLAGCCMVLQMGCRTTGDAHARAVALPGPVLLCPAVVASGSDRRDAAPLAQALLREMCIQADDAVVVADSLPGFATWVETDCLFVNGQPNRMEIAALAAAAACRYVLVWQVCDVRPYVPQRIVARFGWFDAQRPQAMRYAQVDLSLAQADVRDLYTEYVEENLVFGGAGTRDEKRAEHVHTAMLSPAAFAGFAARQALMALRTSGEPGTTGEPQVRENEP